MDGSANRGWLAEVFLQFFSENSTARAMGFDHAIGEAADKLAMLTGGRFGICIGHPLVQ